MAALWRLVRGTNLVISGLGVCAGGWIALGAIAFPKELAFAALSGMAIGAAGNAWNDIRDVAVAVVAGSPPFYGALAVGLPAAGVVPWVLAAWLHLVREIVKDVEDEAGDRAIGRRTLPIAVGRRPALVIAAGVALLFVPASLLLPLKDGYRWAYFFIALAAQMGVLVAATWMLLGEGRVHRVSALLKGAMVIGLIALVAGKVA